tara:strand:- start:63 stop:821 length:759 start_codon:yes stop_codon:yes gene_type:complete
MPTINTPYTYPAGTTLEPASHSENIWGEVSRGLMSTLNGYLDINNFDVKFRIRPDHVMPEQAAIGRQEWDIHETTIFSNGAGTGTAASTARFNVPGCSIRFYQPYAANIALLQWSYFISTTKWLIDRLEGLGGELAPDLHTVVQFDGSDIYHTKRILPRSMSYDTSGGGVRMLNNEAHSALWFDMSDLQFNLAKGWHELRLQMVMQPVVDLDSQIFTEEIALKFGKSFREYDYYMHQKAAFGIRNARVLTML